MKKRLFTTLLSLVLVVAMAMTLPVAAYADNTIKYTLKNGDTVLKVCIDNKIDFYKFQDWITKANAITNYGNLKVGQVLVLPAASVKTVSELPDAATLATTNRANNGINPNAPKTTTTTTTTTATTTTPTAANYTADYVSGYLVYYTLKSGETVYGVCKKLGIDFDSNIDRITKLNNIKSYKSLRVGQTIVIPSTFAPDSGDYVKIVAHKVLKGDTVLAICQNYGISYGANEAKIKELNNKNNLGAIAAGSVLYIPVPAGTNVSSTSPWGSGTGTGTGTGTTVTPSSTYAIRSGSNGLYYMTVNGVRVTSTAPGNTVKIVAQPESGYKVGTVSVITSTGKAVSVNSLSFVMPSEPVTVSIGFVAG